MRGPFIIPNSGKLNPDCGKFIAGGTKLHVKKWLGISHDAWVVNAIKGVKIEWERIPHQLAEPEPYRMSGQKKEIIGGEIKSLLKKGVLEECQDSEGQFISNVFWKPKPNGKFQMI